MGKVHYAVTLGIALIAMWLTLSGRLNNGVLIGLGAASVFVVIVLVERMRLLDVETAPYLRAPQLLAYWAWLLVEIVKANVIVARAVLRADLELTPRLFRVRSDQKTDLGRTMFANSITLTPGTVTIAVDGDDMIVHALLDSMSDAAGIAEMSRRAGRAVEGRRA